MSTHKFSLAHLTALPCPPPEMIYIAAMAGFEYVDLRTILMGLPGEANYDLPSQPEMFKLTKQALKDTGIKVQDIELVRIVDGVDLEKYKPALEAGRDLGATCLTTSVWTDNKPYYTEKYGELCDIAAKFDMTVDVEFVTWASVKSMQDTKEMLMAVNRPNMGILVDTLHFHRSRCTFDQLDSCPKEWFHFAHLCDAPKEIPLDQAGLIHTGRAERLYVGEGEIDIAGILKRLPKTTVYGIEIPHPERVGKWGIAEHVRRCLVTAKGYVDQNINE